MEQFTERGNWDRLLYVHEDIMGNTRYYTKDNGQSFAELEYDVWGAVTSPEKLNNNDNGNFAAAVFTGHPYDTVLDIYFAEARFYDANHRQWMSVDPIKSGLNWYSYAESNPSTYWDANGLWTFAVGYEGAITVPNAIRGALGTALIIDDKLNLGIITYIGGGGGFPSGAGISRIFSVTTADTIFDAKGLGGAVGFSITGAHISGGLEFSIGTAQDNSPVFGFTLSIGAAISMPIEIHGEGTKTYLTSLTFVSDYVKKTLNEAWSDFEKQWSYFSKIMCQKMRKILHMPDTPGILLC